MLPEGPDLPGATSVKIERDKMGIRDKDWVKRSGKGFFIKWNRIRPGKNIRTVFTTETIAERANSLILEGQRNPVRGKLSEDQEYFELSDGEIRWRGWEYAKKELNVNLDDKLGGMYCELQNIEDDDERKLFQLSCGTDTISLPVMDQARTLKELIDSGKKISFLAERMHCSDQHIRDTVALLKLDPELQQAVQKGALKPTAATKTARARKEAQQDVKDKIDRGENVGISDVDTADGKLVRLSVDDIQKQIKEADKLMCMEKTEKGRLKWQAMIRAFRITIGLEEKLI